MGVLSWVTGKRDASHTLVFDIASGSIGMALVYHDEERARVLALERVPLKFVQEHTAEEFAQLISRSLTEVTELARSALAKNDISPKDFDVYGLLHSPWAHSYSTTIDTHLEEETLMTRELLRDFVADALPADTPEGRVRFAQHITRINLNGYSTDEPYGKEASHIAASILLSSTPDAIYTAVTETLAGAFPGHDAHIDAYLYAALQLPELREATEDFTFIDIGGEFISISIIRDNCVLASTHMAFGTTHLVRAIAQQDADAMASAVSLVTMYLSNTCTPSQCRQVEDALGGIEGEWSSAFGATAAELNKEHRLPTPTFVSVDQRFAPWFVKALRKIDFAQFTVTARPLEPHVIDIARATGGVQLAEGVTRDTSLIAAAHFLVDK